jgi:hypothetical protein
MTSNNYKSTPKRLKWDTLRVEEQARHDRDHSPINDQQSVLENRADPCAFHETLRWSINPVSHSLCHVILDLVRGQITDITISCSPSSDKSFNSSMTLHSPWPSHTLASFIDAIVIEWAQSIYLSPGWTNPALGAHASTYSFGIPKRHLFQSPSYVMTVDAIKGASRCCDYVVTSWSKE